MLPYDQNEGKTVFKTVTIQIRDGFIDFPKIPIYPLANRKKVDDFVESSSFEDSEIPTLVTVENPLEDKITTISISEAINRLELRINQIIQEEANQFNRELDELDDLLEIGSDEDI